MLKSLKIDKFKSIYAADLSFGNVNLFVGANGAGKSNILEALGVLAAALSRGIDQSNLDGRGVRLSLPQLFKSAFKSQKFPNTFRLEAQFEHGIYKCSIRAGAHSSFLEFFTESLHEGNVKIFGRGAHGSKVFISVPGLDIDISTVECNRSIWDVISAFKPISNEFYEELHQFSRYSIYSPQTAVMRGLAIDGRMSEPLGLTGSGLAQAFQQMINMRNRDPEWGKKINNLLSVIWAPGWSNLVKTGGFDPSIVPPQVRSEGTLLYIRDQFMRQGRNLLSPYDASEGTLYLIFVATLLGHKDTPKSFGLDNVDGTLNPELVRKLTDHIVQACISIPNVGIRHQAFMTSHHPSSLDSFDIFDKNQQIFTVAREGKGSGKVEGSTGFSVLRPPKNVSREKWAEISGGQRLSELLLDSRIPGALG